MPAAIRATNDNFVASARSAPRSWRFGLRPALNLAYSGLVLVALSGVFLLGLAVLGLLVGLIGGIDLLRRHLWRRAKPLLGTFEHPVIGYRP